jgi:dTDP-4-amino-4,6-dideoxygalactose transaminase
VTQIPMIDLKRNLATIRSEIDDAIARVLDSSAFVLGPELEAFEREFAAASGAKRCFGVADGTDALHLGLRAVGVGKGDEVIVPGLSFFATAEAVVHAGAKPVFVDVEPDILTLDPALVAKAITKRTKAIMPVHLYGHPYDHDAIAAAAPGLAIVEDAAEAHVAKYKGHVIGSLGDAAGFSFYPSKNLGAFGDGGAITTNRDDVAERVQSLRHHGQAKKDIHEEVGWTSRLDDIQAAILRVKLRHLDEWTKSRRMIASWYREALGSIKKVTLPVEREWAEAVYYLYVIRAPNRDEVVERLRGQGIGVGVHFPGPMHRQPAVAKIGVRAKKLKVSEKASTQLVSLPMYPEMEQADVETVAAALRVALK